MGKPLKRGLLPGGSAPSWALPAPRRAHGGRWGAAPAFQKLLPLFEVPGSGVLEEGGAPLGNPKSNSKGRASSRVWGLTENGGAPSGEAASNRENGPPTEGNKFHLKKTRGRREGRAPTKKSAAQVERARPRPRGERTREKGQQPNWGWQQAPSLPIPASGRHPCPPFFGGWPAPLPLKTISSPPDDLGGTDESDWYHPGTSPPAAGYFKPTAKAFPFTAGVETPGGGCGGRYAPGIMRKEKSGLFSQAAFVSASPYFPRQLPAKYLQRCVA